MKEVELYRDILSTEEKQYINDLINDKSKWVFRTTYDQTNQEGRKWAWFDSIVVDYNRLKNYHDLICQNGLYEIGETALNVITKDRQNKNSTHYDNSDLSFSTYFNNNFKGGRFIYLDEKKEKHIIDPEENLTIKINKNVVHAVEEITDGVRFSLYSFLFYKRKNNKSLL